MYACCAFDTRMHTHTQAPAAPPQELSFPSMASAALDDMVLSGPLTRVDESSPRPARPALAPAGSLGFEPIATSLGHLIPQSTEEEEDAPTDEALVGALVAPATTEVGGLEEEEKDVNNSAGLGIIGDMGAAAAAGGVGGAIEEEDAGSALPQRAAL